MYFIEGDFPSLILYCAVFDLWRQIILEHWSKILLSLSMDVNLSIKVPESRRRHWVAEAKRKGTSITAVIAEALNKKLGEPEQ